MALGDGGFNNNNGTRNKVYDNTYYSRIKIKNKDHLVVDFSFSKGLLKLQVSEEKENFRTEPVTSISLSATKAKLLIAKIETFLKRMKDGEFIDPNEGYGVNSGMREVVTFIAFKVTGNRSDVPEHSFVIGKVDQNGNVADVIEFVFNVDYDYSLYWSNVDKMEVEKTVDQFMGIQTILDVLKEFAFSSAGAIGASTWDIGRYEMNRIWTRFDSVFDKLGIERRSNNSNGDNFFTRQGNGSSSGFTGMNPPAHSDSKSYDEIMDDIS